MNITLEYFNTYGPSGKIYVRCLGELPHCKIEYHLYSGDERVKTLSAENNELIAFAYSSPASYKIRADVYPERGNKFELCSEVIQPVIYDLLPPPVVEVRPIKGCLALVPDQQNVLVVKFIKGGLKKLANESSTRVPVYYNLRHAINFKPNYDKITIDKLIKHSPEMEGLRYLYTVEPVIGNDELLNLANELQQLDYVEYCELEGTLGFQPPEWGDTPIETAPPTPGNAATPNFMPRQGYLNPVTGLNIRAVWNRGITGRGLRILMWDTGVVARHEDLTGLVDVIPGFDDPEHGVLVGGIMMARNNGFGITGIAYDAGIRSYRNRVNELPILVADALPGDVVNVSLGATTTWPMWRVPIIHRRDVWDQLGSLVSAGVVVVIAADNGRRDIRNTPEFDDHGDNGIIMVGSWDAQARERAWHSNFNFRNFLNAWGQDVVTTGDGDLFNGAPVPLRRYSERATGTSFAAPMVTAVLGLMQSYSRTRYGTIFNNRQMLQIIETTGYREGVSHLIGVRPNAEAAINYIDQLLGGGGTPPPPPPPTIPNWSPFGVLYHVNDRVRFNGSTWRCFQEHVSNEFLFPGAAAGSPWIRQNT